MFDETATVWDYNRGRPLPDGAGVRVTDIGKLDELGSSLRASISGDKALVLYTMAISEFGYFLP